MAYKYKKIFISFIILFNLNYLSSEISNLRNIELEASQEENIIKPPEFSKKSGFYPENFNLELTSEEEKIIYYTEDSIDPRNSTTTKNIKSQY